MEKCLVTKLQGVVDNDNLVKLNNLRIRVVKQENPTASTQILRIKCNGGFTAKVVGDGYLGNTYEGVESEKLKEFTTTSSSTKVIYLSNGDYYIDIESKYDLTYMNDFFAYASDNSCIGFASSDIKYCTLITNLSSNYIDGNIEDLKEFKSLERFYCRSGKLHGDISKLSAKLTHVNVEQNPEIYGDITNVLADGEVRSFYIRYTKIGSDISAILRKLQDTFSSFFVNDTECYGSVDDFVNILKTKKGESGELNARGLLSNKISFNGKYYPEDNSYSSLEWGGSKIAIYSGASDKGKATRVYCKGYTDSEIQTNAASGGVWSGKEVVKVD